MKSGIYIANFALGGDPHKFVDLSQTAEEAGWDGFFIWDHVYPDEGATKNILDPWIILSAIAAKTKRIKIGTAVTPLPRRRPRNVARETTSLDILSSGRLILGVGLGHPPKEEFEFFGEESDAIIRAEKLDESLEILEGLWSGKPFAHDGKHYKVSEVTFKPRPVQRPRIPIWVASWFSRKKPLKRAANYDGVFPIGVDGPLSPDDYEKICDSIDSYRTTQDPYDVVMIGESQGNMEDDKWIKDYSDSGVNWYLEIIVGKNYQAAKERLAKGPPLINK